MKSYLIKLKGEMKPKVIVKKTVRNTFRFFEMFFGFLIVYLIISLVGGAIVTGNLKKKGDLYIYVQSNGIHTDICLPADSESMKWRDFLPPSHFPKNENFDFVTIGWGDKGFFLDTPKWSELKFSTAFNAVFLPSPTAMHVKYGKEPPITADRKRVYLDKKQYNKLINYVKESFVTQDNIVDLIENKGYTVSDNFYEARHSYHLFRTCNIWTNEALKKAGIRTGIYALFPDGIISHL